MPKMDGNTLLFATAGDPIGQVQTPGRMPACFAAHGINATWVPLHVSAENLAIIPAMLRQIGNFRGCSITIPHKAAVMALVDHVTPRARAAGGVNMIRREDDGTLTGDMLDGLGFVRGLAAAGRAVAGRVAWLVGSGGAGAAIAAALCEAGIGHLHLSDVAPARLRATVERLRAWYPAVAVSVAAQAPAALDFAINATPLGMRAADALPFAVDALPDGVIVCDIIMQPAHTALLRAAAARGLATHLGAAMLTAQIPLYLEFLRL